MNRKDRRAAAKQRNPAALAALAVALKAEGKPVEAVARYREALAFKPDFPEALNNLGVLLKQQGQLDEAAACFERMLALRPGWAETHNNLGNVFKEAGRSEDAMQCYRRALALKPDFAEAHNNLAVVLLTIGRIGEAVSCYQAAVALSPAYTEARINLGLALVEQGRIDEAIAAAEAAARLNRQFPFPHFNFAVLLARCGAIEAAREHFELALQGDPTDQDRATMLRAALGFEAVPERAPSRLIEEIYAARAGRWDRGAEGEHAYRGAALVADALARSGAQAGEILDAGCGTGLVGVLVRSRATRLAGVDLSAPMLAGAKAKNVYDALHETEMVGFMRAHPAAFDVVVSAATLIHFGDLAPVFAAAAQALRPAGAFVFTLFPHTDDAGFGIGSLDGMAQGGCFCHGRSYVADVAAATGYAVMQLEEKTHEYHHGQPRPGLVATLRRA